MPSETESKPSLCATTLIYLFNRCFGEDNKAQLEHDERTLLFGCASEPIYLPASQAPEDYLIGCPMGEMTAEGQSQGSEKIRWFGSLQPRAIAEHISLTYQANALGALPKLNKIFFTRDYFSSALHEIAHWCIAGKVRRQQVDYAYWYAPDGRDMAQQRAFEKAEVKPQALEWAFSLACNTPFRISNDNLSLSEHDSSAFKRAVEAQLERYFSNGFGQRAAFFLHALQAHYGTDAQSLYKQALAEQGGL